MAIENWSERVVVVHLGDDPQFSEDLETLAIQSRHQTLDVVLDFAGVRHINSSNISQLLKLRKRTMSIDVRLIICGLDTHVWGVFLITGLDKIFEFTDDVPTALATLQMD